MSIQAVLLPLFVQVILTFVLLYWMGYLRGDAFKTGAVKARDIALREPNWPPRVSQISNAFHNQLEVPLLFYVLTILSLMTRHADLLFVVMAWIFVVLRLVHAYIHVTDNYVSRRGLAFILGAVVLSLMATCSTGGSRLCSTTPLKWHGCALPRACSPTSPGRRPRAFAPIVGSKWRCTAIGSPSAQPSA